MNPQQRMHKVPVFVKNSAHKKQYVIEGLRRTQNINLIDNMSNMPKCQAGSEIDDQGLCEFNFRLANKHMQPLASAILTPNHFTVHQRSASLIRNEPIVRYFFVLPRYTNIYILYNFVEFKLD